jgi:hypothetical protein
MTTKKESQLKDRIFSYARWSSENNHPATVSAGNGRKQKHDVSARNH